MLERLHFILWGCVGVFTHFRYFVTTYPPQLIREAYETTHSRSVC